MTTNRDKGHFCPPITSSRLESVDGLRGTASLIIVVYHLFTNSLHPEIRIAGVNLLRLMHDGWWGVNLFLVLSGFCLYWPYARHPNRSLEFGRFMVKRTRRIVPAYYLSLVLVPLALLALWWAFGIRRPIADPFELPNGPLDAILHALLLHALWPSTISSWNGVTWSLSLEWMWYLLFPAAMVVFRRVGATRALSLALVVTCAYRVAIYSAGERWPAVIRDDDMTNHALRSFVIGRLFEFGVGMWVAAVAAQGRLRKGWAALALPMTACFLLLGHFFTSTGPLLPIRDILYGLAGGALLIGTVAGAGMINRVMRMNWLVRVGECSYSLYLLHMPVVVAVTALLRRLGLSPLAAFLLSLAAIPAMVGIAWLSYLAAERPFMRAGSTSDREASITRAPAAVIAS